LIILNYIFGSIVLFRESSDLSAAALRNAHSLGLGELNYSPKWTEKQRWQNSKCHVIHDKEELGRWQAAEKRAAKILEWT